MNLPEINAQAENIRDVLRYLKKFTNATAVIHIDDKIIDSPVFSSHISDICLMRQAGIRIIIVPAARKRINEILGSYGIAWKFTQGTRIVSGDQAMPLIKMAAFDVSNKVMTNLAAEKYTAVIGNWVRARGKGVVNGLDYDTAGEIDKIQIESVFAILESGFIPIFPCIGWSITGKPYNISSTQLAAEVASRIKADKLFFLTDSAAITPAFFTIPENVTLSERGCVPALNIHELDKFIQKNIITLRNNEEKPHDTADFSFFSLKRETLSLLELAKKICIAGVSRVHILNGNLNGSLLCEIFSDQGSGTMIYEDSYGGLRPMTLNDIPAVMNLMGPYVEQGALLQRSREELAEKIEDYIVYELDGALRACAALHFYSGNQAEIAAVAVDPSCAHMGLGPKLIAYLLDRAKKQKAESVFVLTTQTADWFEQQGFSLSETDTLPQERKQKWSPQRGSKVYRKSLPVKPLKKE